MIAYDLGAPEFDILYWLYEQYNKIKKGSADALRFVLAMILAVFILIFFLVLFPIYLNLFGIHKMIKKLNAITEKELMSDDKKKGLVHLLATPFADSYFKAFLIRPFYIKYTSAVYRLKNMIDNPEFDTPANYDAMLKDWD